MAQNNSIIQLISGKNRVEINPLGFKIEYLSLDNYIYLNKFVRSDGKPGTSHPCLPIFGPEITTNFNLLQHGNARNSMAKIITQSATQLKLRHEVSEGDYPAGLIFEQDFKLTTQSFELKSTFTNTSHQPLPVNFAQHFYWNAPKGWAELKINHKNMAELVKGDQGFEWQKENIIEIPSLPAIILKQTNLPYVQLWSGQKDNTYDQNYVCIEPAQGKPRSNYFGSKESLIYPQQTINIKIDLSLIK